MSRQTRSCASARIYSQDQPPTPSSPPNHPDLTPDLLPADQAIGTPLLLPKPDEWTRIFMFRIPIVSALEPVVICLLLLKILEMLNVTF